MIDLRNEALRGSRKEKTTEITSFRSLGDHAEEGWSLPASSSFSLVVSIVLITEALQREIVLLALLLPTNLDSISAILHDGLH